MSRHPLIEKVLGLKAIGYDGIYYVRAIDLERALEKGVRVYGESDRGRYFGFCDQQAERDTHTALLIGITQVERDSAESVLRELIDLKERHSVVNDPIILFMIERAKKVLEGK